MGNLVIALLMIGFGLMMRQIFVLNVIWMGLRSLSKRNLEVEEIKKMKGCVIETFFLTFCIVTILLAMSLVAHEGVM